MGFSEDRYYKGHKACRPDSFEFSGRSERMNEFRIENEYRKMYHPRTKPKLVPVNSTGGFKIKHK